MRVCVIGGSGYVGSKLCLSLMQDGHEVINYDLRNPEIPFHLGFGTCQTIQGDVRDLPKLKTAIDGANAIIHLACISNDPASELNPELTKSINLDCFQPCVEMARDAGVQRFIYASSSSVYGIKNEPNVTENLPLEPMTDYSRYKTICEDILLANKGAMEAVVVRPATVCGMSPNLRLDLCVHILTIAALRHGVIKVFGGSQYRPNIHIDDICDAYKLLLTAKGVDGETFNVGHQNLTIMETAEMVRNVIGNHVQIEVTVSSDNRSYHVSSGKIRENLWFSPYRPIGQAIMEIKDAWEAGEIAEPDNAKYHRIRGMKEMFDV